MAEQANLITDVAGIRVGNAIDARVATGVTVILLDAPNVASGVVRGARREGGTPHCLNRK